ncbi:MAG: VOC family protein [Nitrospirales bacterium]|nr:VOC family protein [Nitrospira sp.]MDR4500968.1 VOC family protein [Nitrospirales bacterium]
MSQPGMLGLRHVALNVKDIRVSQPFYERLFDMKVVWQPDSQSVYLSSGSDNLALHQIPSESLHAFADQKNQFLDHLGFLYESPSHVEEMFARAQTQNIPIVKPLKAHRDGSYSFYLADPDGNVVQVLYEPSVAGQEAK